LYEFGPYRLDPAKRVLLRGEEPVSLTPKAFDTLLLLVQNRDRVIPKEELMNRIWPESFVEEANLSQTVFMLRKTLGETAPEQSYIATVRGSGYRFDKPVREIPDFPLAAAPVEPDSAASFGSTTQPQSSRFRPLAAVIVLLLVGALGAGGFYLRSRRTPKLTYKDTVVLSEFDNRTGDPIFDGTLKPALAIDLEQTPFLSLLPDQRVRSTLKLMNRREDERVTRDAALEICQRADSKAVIAGSIVSVGGEYVLSLEVLDCRDNGAVIASQGARSRGKDTVLDALSQAAAALRRDLGESLASIHKFNAPLRQATTSSLEALKAFNAGAELARHGPNPSASIPFYLHAIELDPNFALAYTYLGLAYMNIGEVQRARPYYDKAYALRDRVSEREKLLLTSFYQSDALGDIDKEMETYRIWMEEYPRDWLPVDSLAWRLTFNFNEYKQATQLFSHAMQLDPQQPNSPSGLARSYLALGRTQDAKAVLDTALATGLDNTSVRSALYQLAILQGDAVAETEQAHWSDAQPAIDNLGPLLAFTAAQRGRLEEARHQFQRDVQELHPAGWDETAAFELAQLALIEANLLHSGVRRDADASLALARRTNLATLSIAFAMAGDSARAEAVAREIERSSWLSAYDRRFSLPCVRAAIAISQNNFDEAISSLELMRRYDLGSAMGFQSLYLRGLAFLGKRDSAKAAAEFQTIIDHRGVAPYSPNWTLAHLGLARARVLANDSAGARTAYRQFFTIWKDADRVLPLLNRVEAEYSALR
jgi:DNA-binding winged helix-turn-helix (wHTH) protein/tetratricopeptide (TPR) repeat protein